MSYISIYTSLACIFTTTTSTSHPDPCSTTSQQHPTHVQNNSISRGGNTTPGVTPITTYKAMQVPTKPFPARPASATTGEPPSRRGCHCPPGHCWTYARTRTVAPWWLRTTLSLSASRSRGLGQDVLSLGQHASDGLELSDNVGHVGPRLGLVLAALNCQGEEPRHAFWRV